MASGKVPWIRVGTEVVAIVLSILLAFGIDAWWEAKLERRREQEMLRDLASEFQGIRASIQENLESHETFKSAAVQLLEISRGRQTRREARVTDSLLTEFMMAVSYEPALGVLEAVVSSGDLGILRSDSLRYRLAGWSARIEDVTEEQKWILRDVQYQIIPFLATRLDLVRAFSGTRYADLVLAVEGGGSRV